MLWLKSRLELIFVLLVALGAGPAGAAMWNWSTTAASNASADPTINWAEGMSPSSVNDSARAMMAALAAWRNDISGVNTTTGSGAAYALATSEGVNTTPATGQMVAFYAHATNGASATLTVDGGNTYPLFFGNAAIPSNTLIAGTPYRTSFNGTNWVLEAGYGNPYAIPLGGILASTAPAPNSNFVLTDGACISTTTYAAYWNLLGQPGQGACGASGTFQILDTRGRALVGLDNYGTGAANRLTGASFGCGSGMTFMGASCANGTQSKTITAAQSAALVGTGTVSVSVSTNSTGGFTTFAGNVSVAAGGNPIPIPAGSNTTVTSTGSGTGTSTFSTTNAGGQPHSTIDPNVGIFYYLRVL